MDERMDERTDGSLPLCCHQKDLSTHHGKLIAEADVLVPSFPVSTCTFSLAADINWSTALLEKARGPAVSPARTPIPGWLVAQPDAPQAPGCPYVS